ncbi:MAG: hypothetical protein WA919_18795 [Coleofasciculaceae cyanobacterium]
MNIRTEGDNACINTHYSWFQDAKAACNIPEPILLKMGNDLPLHLMFPVHWSKCLAILSTAQRIASEKDAFLVLMPYGDASDLEIARLMLELSYAHVVALWVEDENRVKASKIMAKIVQVCK